MKLLAVVGITALALLGCSKGGAPTKQQYIAVTDGVCKAAEEAIDDLTEAHLKTNPDGGANQRWVRSELIPRGRTMIQELRSIQPPENDGAYLSDIYASYEHALDLLYSDPLGDRADSAGDAVDARMESYGMTTCARIGDDDPQEK